MMAANTLLKDGYLLKRQRGLSPSSDQRRLKFKQRYIRLDTKALDFFEDQKVNRIKTQSCHNPFLLMLTEERKERNLSSGANEDR